MIGRGGLRGEDRSKARARRNGRILQSRGRQVRYREGRGVRKLGTGIVWVRLRGFSDSGVVRIDRVVAEVKGGR